MEEYQYIAVAKADYGDISQGARVTLKSSQEVEKATGLTFRHEIAEACRQQLGADVAESEEARVAMNFDVYSVQYFENTVKPKLEAAAQKDREREQQRQNRSRTTSSRRSSSSSRRTTSTRRSSSWKKRKIWRLTIEQWTRLLKFLIAVVVIIWFAASQLGSCSLSDLAEQAKETIGVTEKSTTKTKNTSTKKRTSTSKTATTKKSSTKKNTTKKKRSTTKKKSASSR